MLILHSHAALDNLQALQWGTCSVLALECCTDVIHPTDHFKHLQNLLPIIKSELTTIVGYDKTWFKIMCGILDRQDFVLILIINMPIGYPYGLDMYKTKDTVCIDTMDEWL